MGVHLMGVHLTGMHLMETLHGNAPHRRASHGHVSHGRVPYRRHLHLIGVYLITLFRGCTATVGSCLQGCSHCGSASSLLAFVTWSITGPTTLAYQNRSPQEGGLCGSALSLLAYGLPTRGIVFAQIFADMDCNGRNSRVPRLYNAWAAMPRIWNLILVHLMDSQKPGSLD
jgi:hypothetical protein